MRRLGGEGLADFAHPDVVLDVADIPLGVAETAVVEPGQGIVLVEGLHQLHARLHVEHDQGHAQALGNGVGQHGLAGARLALEQQRHLQCHGDIDDPGQFFVQHVAAGAREGGRG